MQERLNGVFTLSFIDRMILLKEKYMVYIQDG